MNIENQVKQETAKAYRVLSSHSLAFIGGIKVSAFRVRPALSTNPIWKAKCTETNDVMRAMYVEGWDGKGMNGKIHES